MHRRLFSGLVHRGSLYRNHQPVQSLLRRPFSQLPPTRALAALKTTMPADDAPAASTETYGNFDLVKRVELDFTPVTVHKWRSRESGLTVVHLDYEGMCLTYMLRVQILKAMQLLSLMATLLLAPRVRRLLSTRLLC